MKPQPDLFNDHPADAQADANADASAQTTRPTGTALRLGGPGTAGVKLSPAQKRFNSLLARIDKLKAQIADLQAVTDAHRNVYQATLAPLRKQLRLHMRTLALWLNERLQGKGMTPAQSRTAHEIFYGVCEGLAADGDEEMRALHDKHSPQRLQKKRRAAAANIQAKMEDLLGKKLPVDDLLDDLPDDRDPLEALLQKAMGQAAEEAATRTSNARHKTGPGKAAQKARQKQ
ncbi:MAG: hypothetical protein LH479_13940, partial [Polaromonas sp.]|nr:hypothetical protein [Polaromonas sp.]